MALTVLSRELGEEAEAAQFRVDVVNFKGDNAYPAGGTVNVAAALGVAKERLLALIPLSHSGYVWDYDSGVDKLKLYQQSAATGALTEASGNLSGVTFRALMIYS